MNLGRAPIDHKKPSAGSIKLRNVRADFPVYQRVVRDRLGEFLGSLLPVLRPARREILSGITLNIEPGETIGLVGVNGAGKTTLLKIISGLIEPSGGTVEVHGRVMALLAMGIGFRPNASGRENVAYGGLLLGMSSQEIESRIAAIADFSGLGSAFDQPYFTYSSGMKARLAFSLATSVPADIIILDETLATGDQTFIGKCYQRVAELRDSGRTILFVSHNLGEVSRMTKRALLLDRGRLAFDGPTLEAMAEYDRILAERKPANTKTLWDNLALNVHLENECGEVITHVEIGLPFSIVVRVDAETNPGRVFLYLKITGPGAGQNAAYLSPNRAAALRGDAEAGLQGVSLGSGSTELRWRIEFWPGGEGEYILDAYVGPPIQDGLADLSSGRAWRSIHVLAATYRNPALRGAGTVFEVPVSEFLHSEKSFNPSAGEK